MPEPQTYAEVAAACAAEGFTIVAKHPRPGRVVVTVGWGTRSGVSHTGRDDYAVALAAYRKALKLAPLAGEGR